jgi:hypothetical protein
MIRRVLESIEEQHSSDKVADFHNELIARGWKMTNRETQKISPKSTLVDEDWSGPIEGVLVILEYWADSSVVSEAVIMSDRGEQMMVFDTDELPYFSPIRIEDPTVLKLFSKIAWARRYLGLKLRRTS